MIAGSPSHEGPLMGESDIFKKLRTVDAQTFAGCNGNVAGSEETVVSLLLQLNAASTPGEFRGMYQLL